MKVSKKELDAQIAKDRKLFDGYRANSKNAIIGELASFWPRTREVWSEKFIDENGNAPEVS